jgi:hypothetical protein
MTATIKPQPSPAQSAAENSVAVTSSTGGFTRLHPADGLFLRAEHLNLIQDYARDLALAGGVAGGTGVVYGYGLALDGDELHVSPGLAIDVAGAPARTVEQVTLSLASLDRSVPGRFWIVEVFAGTDDVLSGSEPLYGELCGDPCAGSTLKPYATSPVRIRVRGDDTLPQLAAASPRHARNVLASAYFEQERSGAQPWLTPGRSHVVAPLQQLPWSDPQPGDAPPGPGAEGVAIGALLRVEDCWVLDVWTARRDLMATPPSNAWNWRLGLRPWRVFLAQVLQFQAHLAEASGSGGPVLGVELFCDAEEFARQLLEHNRLSKQTVRDAVEQWRTAHSTPRFGVGLRGRGFDELPPAGFLPTPTGEGELQQQLEEIFGANVEVRIRHNSADAALRAVTEGQHLDRIPLDQPSITPVVDVWIPDHPADLPALQTASYGWIAFVRNREEIAVTAPPAREPVEVFVVQAEEGQSVGEVYVALEAGTLDLGIPFRILEYPLAEWGVPTTDDSVRDIADEVSRLAGENLQLIGAIGVASNGVRRPLAAARALLLTVGLEGDGQTGGVETYMFVWDRPEATILVVGYPDDGLVRSTP